MPGQCERRASVGAASGCGGDPDDGRAVNVSITDEGRAALAARRDRRAAVLAALIDEADDADRAAIAAAAPALARLAGLTAVGSEDPS